MGVRVLGFREFFLDPNTTGTNLKGTTLKSLTVAMQAQKLMRYTYCTGISTRIGLWDFLNKTHRK